MASQDVKDKSHRSDWREALDIKSMAIRLDNLKVWLYCTAVVAAVCCCDLILCQPLVKLALPSYSYRAVYFVEVGVVVTFFLNTLFVVFLFLKICILEQRVHLTPAQKKLIGISQGSPLFSSTFKEEPEKRMNMSSFDAILSPEFFNSSRRRPPLHGESSLTVQEKSVDVTDSFFSWYSSASKDRSVPGSERDHDGGSWSDASGRRRQNVSSNALFVAQSSRDDDFQRTLSQLRRARSSSPQLSQSFHNSPESLNKLLAESSAALALREQESRSACNALWRMDLSTLSSSPASGGSHPVSLSFGSAPSASFVADEKGPSLMDMSESFGSMSTSSSSLSAPGSSLKYRPALSSSFESDSGAVYSKVFHGTVARMKNVRPVVWTKFQLNADRLDIHSQNLRFWISKTILKPLVNEIDNMDSKLKLLSRSDVTLGECSLSDLQHLSTKADVSESICMLWPYLELCVHQSYLVTRLRQLAADSCIGCFRWDSGSALKGKAWDEHLPTDTEVVFHCLCSYLNTRLPPNPLCFDGKAFSDRYVIRFGEKPQMDRSFPVLHQTSVNPPHFVLLFDGEQYDVGNGKYNMFHTLVLFLQILKLHFNGFLSSVNLHSSGLNILWILDD